MTDLLSSLAQLQQARAAEQQEAQPQLTSQPPEVLPAPDGSPGMPGRVQPPRGHAVPGEGASRGESKTLAGRVPMTLHRELTRGLLDAADALHVRRVNLDEALEAAVRVVLQDTHAHQQWLQAIQAVRRERREEQ